MKKVKEFRNFSIQRSCEKNMLVIQVIKFFLEKIFIRGVHTVT